MVIVSSFASLTPLMKNHLKIESVNVLSEAYEMVENVQSPKNTLYLAQEQVNVKKNLLIKGYYNEIYPIILYYKF